LSEISEKTSDSPNFRKQKSSGNKIIGKKNDFVSWIVFLFCISIVFITLISVVFPALIASQNSAITELEELGVVTFEVDSFTTGIWTASLFVANFVIFVLAILYFKNKLPRFMKSSIDFVFSFEVSNKVAFVTILVFLSIYVGFSVEELTLEEDWEDYPGVKERLENWSPEQITSGFEPHVRYFLLWSSFTLFGYYTVIPFIASISLLLLTYFFTAKITQKRFAGLVALIILLQSHVFLTYDSTVSYTNFWILFYLLSLYLIYKAWPLSPLAFFLSIPSKALTVMFLPMSLYFILRSNISRNKKIIISISSSAVIFVGLAAVYSSDSFVSSSTGTQEEFNLDEFWLGFTSFSYQLRFDGLILIFAVPLVVGLFLASRSDIKHAQSIMVLLGGILLSAPLLTGFTDNTNQPYRFVPFVVFFAVGVGMLLSKQKD